jgi:hypothetical protein
MTAATFQPYFNLAGGVCTLIAVALTLIVTGRRAQHDRVRAATLRAEDTARQHAATAAQFLGLARVVRERLGFAYLAAARPIEGFAAFDRWLDLAYSAPIALLVADRDLSIVFFTLLGEWERAYGSMLYSFERLREPNLPSGELETRRQHIIEAATAAAMIVDTIRRLFGDESEVVDVKLRAGELAPSVRRERGIHAYHDAMREPRSGTTPLSLDDATAIVDDAMREVDVDIAARCSRRITPRGDRFDVHVISAGTLNSELETAIRLRLGEHLGTLRVDY